MCASVHVQIGHFTYEGKGAYEMHKRKGVAKHLSMLAGGTGITPIYAVMTHILRDPEDKTCMSLIFCNVAEEDILLRKELDQMSKDTPDRLKVRPRIVAIVEIQFRLYSPSVFRCGTSCPSRPTLRHGRAALVS